MARKALLSISLALTLAALAPAVASGASFFFESSPVIVKGTGQGSHVLDLAGGSLSCEEVKLESEWVGFTTMEILLFTPSYGGCTMFGGKATVSTGKCLFQLTSNGQIFFGPNSTECNLDPMVVDVSVLGKTCRVELSSQIWNESVSYGNKGTGSSREVTIGIEENAVFYKAEGSLCKETGSKSNGLYTSGPTALTAEREGQMYGMFWE